MEILKECGDSEKDIFPRLTFCGETDTIKKGFPQIAEKMRADPIAQRDYHKISKQYHRKDKTKE